MKYECKECNAVSRRAFLKRSGAGLAALAFADPLLNIVAQSYGATKAGTGNLLVLCQLNGGFDGLSFLAPFTNNVYKAKRPQLALTPDRVWAIPGHEDYGMNHAFDFFWELYQQNQLAIVQQVAYPDGNGSHFESQEIFEFGVRNLGGAGATVKWYERLRKTYFNEAFGVLDTRRIGDPRQYGFPDNTYWKAGQEAFGRLAKLKADRTGARQEVLSAYERIDEMGALIRERTASWESVGPHRGDFHRAAALASADLGTQVIKLEYGGYDTHALQPDAEASLFPTLNNHFRQFVDDIKALGMWERTCVVFYTEFGRRNEENGSPGTDHGHGGHMILAGPGVRGGLFGQAPTTWDLNQSNLPYYVDFRGVFSSAIKDWLGFNPDPIFKLNDETFDENVGGNLFR